VGHQILSARFAGAGQPGGIRDSARATAVFSGCIAVACVVACAALGGPLTGLISRGQPQLEHIGSGFMLACCPTLLLLVPFTLCSAVINAYKRPRYTMLASVLVNLINLALDRVLIYGAGPFPRLGATGSGLATTLSWAAGLLFIVTVAWRLGLLGTIRRASSPPRPDFETSIVKLASPAIVSMGLDYMSTAVFFAIIGGVAASALGGGRIAWQVMVLAYGVLSAFSAGARVLVGRALGAKNYAEAFALWRAGQRILALFALPITGLLLGLPAVIGSIFTSFPLLRQQASVAIMVVGFCLPLMALTLGNVSALRALGKTRWDMYGNLLAAVCVEVPLCWILADGCHLGIRGAFAAVAGYWLARGVISEVLARRAMRAPMIREPAAAIGTAATAR
jgi:multidrug resistance protein, MATE family